MKTHCLLCACALATVFAPSPVAAHLPQDEGAHGIVFDETYRARMLADFLDEHGDGAKRASQFPAQPRVASNAGAPASLRVAAMAVASAKAAPTQAAPFLAFAPSVNTRWDSDFLYIESNGIPAHNMMVGITNWQQQVPLPHPYQGDNAWRIPLHPVVAKQPLSIKGRFLRGAIALAANGIPIFNPQNNRGEVSQEIGELDQWGGHCGRADDYHYHAAPLHLQSVVGKGPIAFALDGYPIFGLTEPDGTAPGKLDEFNGHDASKTGYHYHASTKYPYVNGGFHGEVVEREGQVDPQPRAGGVRGAGTPLRGAKITGFESVSTNSHKLSYEVNGDKRAILYSINTDGTFAFEYQNGAQGTTREVYSRRQGGGGEPRTGGRNQVRGGPNEGRRPGPNGLEASKKTPGPEAVAPVSTALKPGGSFVLSSPVVADGGTLPVEFTGDGAGVTPPLAWTGAPAGTKNFAVLMDHLDPEGVMKWYWTLYDIPANVTNLPKDVQGVGKVGTGFRGKIGYEPPHSQGPGAKTYVLTVYALSAPLQIKQPPAEVNREVLIAAMKDKVLASSSLHVVFTRGASAGGESGRPRGGQVSARNAAPQRSEAQAGGAQGGQRKPWIQMHGAELDADKDGVVTAIEAAADMKRAFAFYDRDQDGVITPKEIDAAGDIREGAAFAGFIYRHAIDLDANNDSALTIQEALAAAKYLFESADQDHDGKVTPAEIASAPNAPLPVPTTTSAAAKSAGTAPQFAAPVQLVSAAGGAEASGKPGDAPPVAPGAGDGKGKGKGGPEGKGKGKGGAGKGGPDNKGLIKPAMSDTVHINVYADNWFVMFINGELVAVDSIKFTPHNVVSLDILPEYPMTIAVMAKDNADPKTGMEYGDHIGDGGLTIKFADGTVSNASWKAKNFFKGPLDHETKNPKVEHTPIPDKWWAVDFDDSKWSSATEYTEERVNPKEPYYNADFAGAKFIWSEDLDLDNTVIFRTKVEKPGWTKRWNTKPDLDVSEAPVR